MLQTLVREFPYIHKGIGLVGNTCFFVGSVLFFKMFRDYYTFAVWLFVIGSFGMLLGTVGEIVKTIFEARERRAEKHNVHSARERMKASA